MKYKSQAGIVLSIVLFLIFLSISLYLLQEKPSESKAFSYEDEYAYSILRSLLRSTTISPDTECKYVKDIANKYIYITDDTVYCCRISNLPCKEFITREIETKLSLIEDNLKKQYYFYFEIGIDERDRQRIVYAYGNKTIKECKANKVSAKQYLLSGRESVAKPFARVILMRRDEICLK